MKNQKKDEECVCDPKLCICGKRKYIQENQQNTEEWEKKFDDAELWVTRDWDDSIGDGGTYEALDENAVKEFIRQQRQEAYDEGHNEGFDFAMNSPALENMKKQAVREFVEIVLKEQGAHEFSDSDPEAHKCVLVEEINQALKVYEGK